MQVLWNEDIQALWDFDGLSMGFENDSYRQYFSKMAAWKPLGEVEMCDPSQFVDKRNPADLALRYELYFRNGPKKPGGTDTGYTTAMMSEAAGFALEWTLKPRFLKINPGKWNEPAPLPETKTGEFIFWYCPMPGGFPPERGGSLQITLPEGKVRDFPYQAHRAVLSQGLPHVLLPINNEFRTPYYCLYGQLSEVK